MGPQPHTKLSSTLPLPPLSFPHTRCVSTSTAAAAPAPSPAAPAALAGGVSGIWFSAGEGSPFLCIDLAGGEDPVDESSSSPPPATTDNNRRMRISRFCTARSTSASRRKALRYASRQRFKGSRDGGAQNENHGLLTKSGVQPVFGHILATAKRDSIFVFARRQARCIFSSQEAMVSKFTCIAVHTYTPAGPLIHRSGTDARALHVVHMERHQQSSNKGCNHSRQAETQPLSSTWR